MLFSAFPYDYPLLWTSEPTPAAYYDFYESHIKFLHASPPIIPRLLHISVAIGFIGFFTKLFKPSEAVERLEACVERLRGAARAGAPLRLTIAGALLDLDRSGRLRVRPEPPRSRGR